MSTIKTYESKVFGTVNIETFNSANEVASTIETRTITDKKFSDETHGGNFYHNAEWVGATRDEAYTMLREGYQPVCDELKRIKMHGLAGTEKRVKQFNNVAGFQPIIPNAIMGLPNSMIDTRIMPIKTKVLDIYYDCTASSGNKAQALIDAGKKMLSVVLKLEQKGYRFNIYAVQDYYRPSTDCDMLCVKVKSASQPLDIKRMSFPMAHSAFFRGIGFEWYAKFPKGKYRFGFGHAFAYAHSQETIQQEFTKMFGRNAIFFAAKTLIENHSTEKYIEEVIDNAQH